MFIRQISDIVGNSKKSFSLMVGDLDITTPCWSATSSLLHKGVFKRWGVQPPPPEILR